MSFLRNYFVVLLIIVSFNCFSQNYRSDYDLFKNNAQNSYHSFRDECNRMYVEFLREAWDWYEGKAPIPMPKDESPVPPKPYIGEKEVPHIDIEPVEIDPIDVNPQPKPIEPIKEIPTPDNEYFTLDFYGQKCNIRLPKFVNLTLNDCQPSSIASGWESLCNEGMNNTIRDCLETRIRYNLCD